MLRGALGQRKLWTITCESLLQIVFSSLSPDEIEQLGRKHLITLPEDRRGRVALYQVAHTQCHLDSPFSRQVQRALNCKHAVTIERPGRHRPRGRTPHCGRPTHGWQYRASWRHRWHHLGRGQRPASSTAIDRADPGRYTAPTQPWPAPRPLARGCTRSGAGEPYV